MSPRLLIVLITAFACKGESSDRSAPPPPVQQPAKPMKFIGDPCKTATLHGTFAWIEDDYPRALACAKSKNLPLVLDLWAPWCHTCLSMQSTVFTDRTFEPDAAKFVFASLDTDREANADAVAQYPLSAWPTFYVVSPDEAVLARFVGAASVSQFHGFLDTGARARAGGTEGPDAHLLAAERARALKDNATAEKELVAALAAAPATWPRKPDALVSLVGIRRKLGDISGCIDLTERSLDETGNTASASDFLFLGLECAAERDKADPDRVKKLRERAVARLQKLVADPNAPLSVDDRSDAMGNLRAILDTLGNNAAAKAVAEQQRTLLDAAAAKATSPMVAMTYNWPRAEVYVYLGRPLDLVPALEQSAKGLPNEYDPRARLGWLLFKADKLDEAVKWTDEALKLVYGPRKARVLTQRAEIANKQGDRAAEKLYRQELVKLLEALPVSQVQSDEIVKAKQAVANLE
ncbi:MAG: hypothetical protein H6Q90_4698 [Deltaproteobacteria bacterium]|nr:hypothetical protein [Deltaproteobacteria bacterium]